MKRPKPAWIVAALGVLLVVYGLAEASYGIWQLTSFRANEPERYERIFAGRGYDIHSIYDLQPGEDRDEHIRKIKEAWNRDVLKTISLYWYHIDHGLSIFGAILLTGAFYVFRIMVWGIPGNRFVASPLSWTLAAIATGTIFFSFGLAANAVISTVHRGYVPHWADSIIIPVFGALFASPLLTLIMLSVGFIFSKWGKDTDRLFPKTTDRSWGRFAKEEVAGLPFIVLAALFAAASAPEVAIAVPFLLHAGLSLRARAIARGGEPNPSLTLTGA